MYAVTYYNDKSALANVLFFTYNMLLNNAYTCKYERISLEETNVNRREFLRFWRAPKHGDFYYLGKIPSAKKQQVVHSSQTTVLIVYYLYTYVV